MLFSHILYSPDQKLSILESWFQKDMSFIVADLESKFWLQNQIRPSGEHFLVSDRILRASEFWQNLLVQKDSSWQTLDQNIAQFFMEKWMEEGIQKYNLNISSKDSSKALHTLKQILPLLTHFQGQDVMQEWFEQSEEAQARWGEWYTICLYIWDSFCHLKSIPQDWMKALLINEELPEVQQDFVFDLGYDIDDIESELILNLSRQTDVHILVPYSQEQNEIYQYIVSRSEVTRHECEIKSFVPSLRRLPSMLSEVKEAVAQLREWLEEKRDPASIAIVSPIIENYWPTLSEYLMVEGIPCQKNKVTPLSQMDSYQNWLAQMRLAFTKADGLDGEQIFFVDKQEPLLEFKTYTKNYSHIYDRSDFEKKSFLKQSLPRKIDFNEKVQIKAFLEWSLNLLRRHESHLMDRILEDLEFLFHVDEKLSYWQWYQFLENHLSRTEQIIAKGEPNGVAVLSLAGATNQSYSNLIVLGLNEDNLIETQRTSLLWSDIESIKLQFGFNLPHSDRMQILEKLDWLCHKQLDQMTLTIADTDFSGRFQAPSVYWLQESLKQQKDIDDLDAPLRTRWDELMLCRPDFSIADSQQLQSFVDRDKGLQEMKPVAINDFSLSATSFDDYAKCPFVLFSKKAFGLESDSSMDLDIDPMSKGQLLHRLLELIVKQGQWSLTESQVSEFVEKVRVESKLETYSENTWRFLKPFYVHIVENFLQYESELRKKFSKRRNFEVEAKVHAYLAVVDEKLTFNYNEGVLFRGKIDRIDWDGDSEYLILDYKTSGGYLRAASSWVEQGQLQLLLYSLLFQDGCYGDQEKEVVGAFYFLLKNLDAGKGFVIKEVDPTLAKASRGMTREKRDELFEKARTELAQIFLNIQSGQFQPHPKNEDDCLKCDWNQLCRYHRLNQ